MDYKIKEETLNDIADAIREKTNTTDRIKPENMDDMIRSIAGGSGVEVFFIEYGVTPAEDIIDAYEAGKMLVMKKDITDEFEDTRLQYCYNVDYIKANSNEYDFIFKFAAGINWSAFCEKIGDIWSVEYDASERPPIYVDGQYPDELETENKTTFGAINEIKTNLIALTDKVNTLVGEGSETDVNITSGYITGYIYLNNGTVGVSTNSLYGRVDNIELGIGEKIEIYTYASASFPKTIPIAKKNDNGTYSVLVEPTETGKNVYSYTASEPITVCVSFNTQSLNNDRYCKIIKQGHSVLDDVSDLNTRVSSLEDDVEDLQSKIGVDSPLKNTNYDLGFARQLKSITFVGDSYTQGNFDRTNGSAMEWDEVNYYNIPSVVGRLTGATIHNSGISGATASDSEEAQTRNMSYLKLATMGGRSFITESDKAISYYIFLGINDSGSLGGFSGDVDTDIDANNYENCNRNTSVGAYGYIIGKIRSIQPNAIIFCETPSHVISPYNIANSKIYTEVAPKVRQICEKLNCECVDMQMYFHPEEQDAKSWHDTHYNGGHPNALGYYEMAVARCSYIGWIIKNNLLKYRNIQFIGTNMDYQR